jgi:lipase chaperone LimK
MVQEYKVRKAHIIAEKNLYGKEKEKRISRLRSDFWGAEAGILESLSNPYERYMEKLQVYTKDLAELDDAVRNVMIKEFRKEYFSPDTLKKLENLDDAMAFERLRERDYRSKEGDILNDPSLSQDQKTMKIEHLRDEIFGDEAEAFRRRENISRGSSR